MASFGAVCNAVMQAFNCPAGNNASSYAPGNALSCTCGSFNPTNAVIALVQDAVLANFYNATLAGAQPVSIVAATCAPATAGDPRTTGLTAAVVILALLLAGALAYIIYPFCGARDTSRMIGGSRATQRMKMNPAASVIEA